MSSKNNLNPDHYKVAGRGRPGDHLAPRAALARIGQELADAPGIRHFPGDVIRTRPIQIVQPTRRRPRRAEPEAPRSTSRKRSSSGARGTRKRVATAKRRQPRAGAKPKARASKSRAQSKPRARARSKARSTRRRAA